MQQSFNCCHSSTFLQNLSVSLVFYYLTCPLFSLSFFLNNISFFNFANSCSLVFLLNVSAV